MSDDDLNANGLQSNRKSCNSSNLSEEERLKLKGKQRNSPYAGINIITNSTTPGGGIPSQIGPPDADNISIMPEESCSNDGSFMDADNRSNADDNVSDLGNHPKIGIAINNGSGRHAQMSPRDGDSPTGSERSMANSYAASNMKGSHPRKSKKHRGSSRKHGAGSRMELGVSSRIDVGKTGKKKYFLANKKYRFTNGTC